ncbi:ADP-ribosyltransferase [Bacillus pseudomycoides]|nr:ADP-ribosyltransferase [Bacillus pseudomycoides]
MDVHYKPGPWQDMKEGIDKLTKEALMELRHADNSLEQIEAKIHSLDADRSIHFGHSSQQTKINKLLDDYTTLGNYCTRVGQAVSKHIDEPFYKDMDKFAGKMRDLSIQKYSTKNRIGSTTTTTMPNAHGYGAGQTITTKKDKITVDDIFKDSVAFDKVLHAQYKEIKAQNPDAELDYAEYRKLVPSMRGFEYKTIEDEQKKLETVRDLIIGGGLVILSIACPPVGLTAAAFYGGLQLKSAYDGKDWGTGRKLSNSERVENGIFGALDAIPVLGTAAKAVNAFKGTIDLGALAKLTKLKDGATNFNPNFGKNVVQSLQDGKNTWLRNLKIKGWEAADKLNDLDHAIKRGVAKVVDGTTGGSNIAKDLLHGSPVPAEGVMGLRRGTDWEAAVKASHEMEKGRIHNNISRLKEEASNAKLNKQGLTPEREKYYRKKIDEAKARGEYKVANDARYERYYEGYVGKDKPLDRKDWEVRNKNLRKIQERGREEEGKGRKALEEHLDRKLENNNVGEVVTYTSSEGHLTRPDSIGRNAKGEIDLVHDHKHKISDKEHVIHNDSQMRAERELAQETKGHHVVTLSSDKPDLNGIPPKPRPSGPLGKESEIYYTDPKSGKLTHKWEAHPDLPGGGIWIKI